MISDNIILYYSVGTLGFCETSCTIKLNFRLRRSEHGLGHIYIEYRIARLADKHDLGCRNLLSELLLHIES